MLRIVIISVLSATIFGLIDGLFFLVAEDELQKRIVTLPYFDEITGELLTGGISAAVAIFFATLVSKIINKKYKIEENPIYEFIGILVGTIIIILIYNFIKMLKRKKRIIKNKKE